jgi:hypothetical protein
MISDDGKYWVGWTSTVASQQGYVPKVGEALPDFGRVPVDAELYDRWEKVRQDLINNRLGSPNEGINTLLVPKVQVLNICTCDTSIMARNGCPSSKGYPCPDLHEE